MQLSRQQVYDILQIVEIYKQVQAPLAKKKADSLARIAQLLALQKPSSDGTLGPSPLRSPAVAAAVAEWSSTHGLRSLRPQQQAAASTLQPAVAVSGHLAGEPAAAAGVMMGRLGEDLAGSPEGTGSLGLGNFVSCCVKSSPEQSANAPAGATASAPKGRAACPPHSAWMPAEGGGLWAMPGETVSDCLIHHAAGNPSSWAGAAAARDIRKPSAGTVAAAATEFPLGGANYHELLVLMHEVDSLQTKTFWLDQCCCFHTMGTMTWGQIATLTTGFHPFPPMNLLWVRRLVARTSLMLLLPTLPYFVPTSDPPAAAGAVGEDEDTNESE